MTVAFSGNLITQSGTDTDASIQAAVLAVAGVTSITESSGCVRLIVPWRFQVNGTLTTTGATAFTLSRVGTPANEVVIAIGGRWNYKESKTASGLTDWRAMPPMIFTQATNNGFNGQTANLIYVNGGIQDFAKVRVIGNGGHYWNGGTIIIRDCEYLAEGLAAVNDNQITTQSGNPTLDIDGLEYRGTSLFLQNFVKTNLKRLQPKFAIRGFGSGFGLTQVIEDYDGKGTGFDLSIYAAGQNSLIISKNGVKGGGVTCGPWNAPNNNNNEYQATADLQLVGVNDVGATVMFKAYHLDNNAGAPVGTGKTATNYTLRKTYNVASTVGGVATVNVLLAAGLNDNAMVRRAAVQTGDLYTFTCFSYLSQPTVTTAINLAGAGIKQSTVVQLRDFSISQTVKATVDAYTAIDTLDKLYDRAKSFSFDTFAGETSALFADDGTTLNAGSRDIVLDSAAAAVFALAGNTITIKATAFTAGAKFKSLATTGTVTVANGSSITGVTIAANVTQPTPANLTGVTITGTLTYTTPVVTPVTFTNSTTGTVSNSGTAVIPIKRINSTLTAGTNVTAYSPTSLAFTLSAGRIRLLDNVGAEQFNQTADGTFELPAAATGIWTYVIRKYAQLPIVGSFVVDGTAKSIVASYIPDTQVVAPEATVAAYVSLESAQQIYDRLSLFGATAAGIVFGVVASKGFGTITIPGGFTPNPAAVALISVAAGFLTTATATLQEAVTIISSGNFINDPADGAILSRDVAIRAANLDSELVHTADALTFYPSAGDRNAGTNPGLSIGNELYRFKLGNTISGVLLSGTLALRVTVGGITFFADLAIASGRNVLDLGVQSQLAAINAKTLTLPQIEASQVLATKADVWAAAN